MNYFFYIWNLEKNIYIRNTHCLTLWFNADFEGFLPYCATGRRRKRIRDVRAQSRHHKPIAVHGGGSKLFFGLCRRRDETDDDPSHCGVGTITIQMKTFSVPVIVRCHTATLSWTADPYRRTTSYGEPKTGARADPHRTARAQNNSRDWNEQTAKPRNCVRNAGESLTETVENGHVVVRTPPSVSGTTGW